MRRIHDSNLVFVHIPKNAGQAITNCFGCSHESSDHSLNSDLDKTFMSPPFVRFAVVRNPVERFKSAYKYHCHMSSVNTDKIFSRDLIVREKLDRNINHFVQAIIDEELDLQDDLWFRRQVFWLRSSKPQIILRFENLKTDLDIVKACAPKYFTGLKPKNVSKGREKSDQADTELNPESLSFIENFYAPDFFYLSYPSD